MLETKILGLSGLWPLLCNRLGLGVDTDPANNDVTTQTLWLALPPPSHGEVPVQQASHLLAILRQVSHYGGVPLYKNQANLAPRLWFMLRQDSQYDKNLQGREALPSIMPSVEGVLWDPPSALGSADESTQAADVSPIKSHGVSSPVARGSPVVRIPVAKDQIARSMPIKEPAVRTRTTAKKSPSDGDMPSADSDQDSFGIATPQKKDKDARTRNKSAKTPKPTKSPKPAKTPTAIKPQEPPAPAPTAASQVERVRSILPQAEPIVIEDDEDGRNGESSDVVPGSFEEADELNEIIEEADQVFPLSVDEERDLWHRACLFFGHDAAACDPQNPGHHHRVAGLRLALRPDQMWSVFRMLSAQEMTGLYGTLLADGFGLGKTLQATAVAVVAALVHLVKNEVMDEWAAAAAHRPIRRRHLPRDQPQTDAMQCPSGTYRLGFACPCVKRLPTHTLMNIIPGPGALFIVPSSLLAHWTAKLAAYVDLDDVSMFPQSLSDKGENEEQDEDESDDESDDESEDESEDNDGEDDEDEVQEKREVRGKSPGLSESNGPFFQLVCVRAGDSVNRMSPAVIKRFLMIDTISAGLAACAPFLANVLPIEGLKKKDEGNCYFLSSRCRVPCPLVVVPSSSALSNTVKVCSTVGQIQQAHKRHNPDLPQKETHERRVLKAEVPFPFQPSMVFIDEAHKVKGKDTFLWKMVRQLVCRSQYPLFLYPCSATPTPKDANDLQSFVDILACPFGGGDSGGPSSSSLPPSSVPPWLRRNTAHHKKLVKALRAWHSQSRSMVSQVEAMSREVQDASPAGRLAQEKRRNGLRKQAEAATALRLALFKQVAIARAGDHQFLGKYAIQKLPQLQIEELPCPTEESARGQVVELSRSVAGQIRQQYHEYVKTTHQKKRRSHKRNDGSGDNHILTLEEFASRQTVDPGRQTLFYDLHLCAVFPALARYVQSSSSPGGAAGRKFLFRTSDFVGFRQPMPDDSQSWANSPYWPYIAELCAHSSKLAALCRILDAMRADVTPHRLPSGKKAVLAKRAVVFTARPPVAYLVALALRHHYGGRVPVSMVLDMTSQKQRRDLLAPFEGPVGEEPEDGDGAGIHRVLVTTIGTSAEGLDLTRASYAIVLEPYWNHDQERQALGRVQRAGQCAAQTHLYKLMCPDNIAERLVQCRQMGRRAATQGWDMQEALRVFLREN